MSERFFLDGPLAGPELRLAGTEAHHLSHVLRLGAGETVTLFDGRGEEARAEVVAASKRGVTLRVISTATVPPPPPITLAVAPPKGDRFRWLVEKATELGVSRLVPLRTRRGVVDPRESKLDKLRQTVVAACKQSGRSHLMAVAEPVPFDRFLAEPASSRCVLLDPQGTAAAKCDWSGDVTLLIGPEGGFTDEEKEAARAAGAAAVSLGRTILRVETAAVAAAAVAVALRG